MIIKCPACGAEYECDPGKYQCACGAKFCVAEDGKVSLLPVALTPEEDVADNTSSAKKKFVKSPLFWSAIAGVVILAIICVGISKSTNLIERIQKELSSTKKGDTPVKLNKMEIYALQLKLENSLPWMRTLNLGQTFKKHLDYFAYCYDIGCKAMKVADFENALDAFQRADWQLQWLITNEPLRQEASGYIRRLPDKADEKRARAHFENGDFKAAKELAQILLAEEARLIAEEYLHTMIKCPAGSFIMGSPDNEVGRSSNKTQHKVTLTKPFWIGKYEVTQKQYQAVMGENSSRFGGDDLPVETVYWDDAMKFCEALNAATEGKRPAGYKFSLPTEAQWEYACRAGTTSDLNNGRNLRELFGEDVALNKVGWYDKNSGEKTHPVGQKTPNAWGIYDMHGNVWEWCLDWYGDYSGDAVDPAGPSSGSYRVCRGGSCDSHPIVCGSANRYFISPGYRYSDLGFRVALVPVQ